MVAQVGYATHGGVQPYGNPVRHHLNSKPAAVAAEPGAYSSTEEVVVPIFSSCSTAGTLARPDAFPTKNAGAEAADC